MLKTLPWACALLLTLSGALHASPQSLEAYRTESSNALQVLLASSPETLREQAILAVLQAPSNGIDEALLDGLAAYREQQPDDLYAKMYEGYGWLFTAGEYLKKQNYFRAAELAKRGFFLMDEAVDQAPEDWRLRFLRARLDLYVPAEFGRHVVALKDLRYLEENSAQVPGELSNLLDFLQIRAYSAAGQTAQLEPLRRQLADSALWGELLLEQGRLFLTAEEIQHVLTPILEGER